MRATVGSMVLYVPFRKESYPDRSLDLDFEDGEYCAAVVTAVAGDAAMLAVFLPGAGGIVARGAVRYSASRERNTWHWPQKG